MKQDENGRFSKSYKDDLKTALHLLDEYEDKKESDLPKSVEAFAAVHKFVRNTRLNKAPIRLFHVPRNGRPEKYMPPAAIFLPFLEILWPPDAESTALHAILSFRVFLISYNLDDYLEGAISLSVVEQELAPFDKSLNPKLIIYAKKLHDQCVPEVLKRWV
jgi:hypothetical protein